jgi:catechol 2,3-dioxygenase-like lactoylglutathione lyase family enzyme
MTSAAHSLGTIAMFLVALLIAHAPNILQQEETAGGPTVVGLDHIPIAVADLDIAAERYRQLGFTLKPGRPHNGIRNQHVKFRDGTEIELITASEARDSLATEYRQHLVAGDGPAFVALYAPEISALARRLDAAGQPYHRAGTLLSFPQADGLRYIFFGQRNRSPTDRAEHFSHPNGAEKLMAVWLASDDFTAERTLLSALGASWVEKEVRVPEPLRVTVAELPEGEVWLLPGSRQLVPGRRIVGATVYTQDLAALNSILARTGRDVPPTVQTKRGKSVFLSPSITSGIWLEFREPRL